ncbi:MAG: hypothetical protein KIT17_16345 [Rubrivivax sp.]|nr:hypothetical protein [Rubrivivax sp.]
MKTFRLTMTAALVGGLFAAAAPAQAVACGEERLTRAEVVAATHAARERGELGVMAGEDSGSFWMSRQPVAVTPRAAAVAQASPGLAGEDGGSFALSRETLADPRTRAEVQAEAALANRLAWTVTVTGEDGGAAGVAAVLPREDRVLAQHGFACPMPMAALRTVVR